MAYIGQKPILMQSKDREVFTFTSPSTGTTTFSGNDDAGKRLAYNTVSGATEVFVNGVMLNSADFTATSGTSVVLATGTFADDLVTVITYTAIPQNDTVSKTAGGTFQSDINVDGNVTINSDLSVDSDAMYVDTTNDRVGIGTATPHSPLHVAKAGNEIITVERTNKTSGTGQFAINVETTSQTTFAYDNSSNFVIGRSSDPKTQAGFNNDILINSGGNMIKQNQVFFHAYFTSSINITTSNQVIAFDQVRDNVGGHFNTSTYRFTVPYTGVYLLSAGIRWNYPPSSGYVRFTIRGNGSQNAAQLNILDPINSFSEISYQNSLQTVMMNLYANDYYEVIEYSQNTGGQLAGNECHFQGYLLG